MTSVANVDALIDVVDVVVVVIVVVDVVVVLIVNDVVVVVVVVNIVGFVIVDDVVVVVVVVNIVGVVIVDDVVVVVVVVDDVVVEKRERTSKLTDFGLKGMKRRPIWLRSGGDFYGPSSASFSFIFGLFKQTIQILQQINEKNVHPVSSAEIQTHDLLIMILLL